MFHGPTFSFKDLPLAVVGPIISYALEKNEKRGFVYICTSRDTGSAVINVTKKLANVNTFVMFPDGDRITELQRLLMTTISSENIHNFAGNCCCDNFDIFWQEFAGKIKEAYPQLIVTSLNSSLWLRIMLQVAHLMYAYFQVSNGLEYVDIVIPTGGAGHLSGKIESIFYMLNFLFTQHKLMGRNFEEKCISL